MTSYEVKNYLSVQEFYSGKSVFITGATGFLGKLFLEKLLRSCHNIDKIYILIRAKKGKNVQQRVEEFTSVAAFDKLRESNPMAFEKIVAIEGDIEEENFGISEDNLKVLFENVGVVIHSAATVSFTKTLRVAVQINLLGTMKMLHLCRQMKKLESVVYVSTAYTNVGKSEGYEVLNPQKFTPNEIINLVNTLSDENIEKITPNLLGDMPNTYTFTKALAEMAIETDARDLPITIVRPSIVSSSIAEPMPGWVDSFSGPVFFVVYVGKGFLKAGIGRKEVNLDFIPVDMTVNMCIVAAWHVATRKPSEMMIYNCTSGHAIKWNFNEISTKLFIKYLIKHPMLRAVSYPSFVLHESKIIYKIHTFFAHVIPAYLMDIKRVFQGKPAKIVKLMVKVDANYESTKIVTSDKNCTFISENSQNLMHSMSEHDKEIFPFDVRKIDVENYMENYVLGIRKYLLKEDENLEAIEEARVNFEWFKVRDKFIKFAFIEVPLLSFILVFCYFGLSAFSSIYFDA